MEYTNFLPTLDNPLWEHWGATNVVKEGYNFSATFSGQWEALAYRIMDGSLNGKRVKIGFESLIGERMELCLQDQNWNLIGESLQPSSTPSQIIIDIPETVTEVKFMVSVVKDSGDLTCDVRGLYLYVLEENLPTPSPAQYDCYVSATRGLDTNNGTFDTPYKTIQKALNNTKSAGVIFIEEGVYNESINVKYSGTSDKYFTIKGAGVGKTIIDGAGKSKIFDFNGKSYINLEDITFQNINAQWGVGIRMGNAEKYINIRNCEIKDIHCKDATSSGDGANPIICYGASLTPISHVTIDNLYVHDCTTGWCEAIAISGNCEYIDVLNCRVDNTGNIGIDFCGNFGYCQDPSLDQPRHCKAVGNVISRSNSPNATSYGLYADGAVDILFDKNIIYNCQGGIEIGSEEPIGKTYPCKDIVVQNNLIYNCTEVGVHIGAYYTGAGMVENVKFYNNTIYNATQYQLMLSIGDGFDFRNNIFCGTGSEYLVYNGFANNQTTNLTFKNNLWYTTNANYPRHKGKFAMWGNSIVGYDNFATAVNEMNGNYETPSFKNVDGLDFELSKHSVAINKGDNSVDVGTIDLKGNNRRVETIDIGCYEFVSDNEAVVKTYCYIGDKKVIDVFIGTNKIIDFILAK